MPLWLPGHPRCSLAAWLCWNWVSFTLTLPNTITHDTSEGQYYFFITFGLPLLLGQAGRAPPLQHFFRQAQHSC